MFVVVIVDTYATIQDLIKVKGPYPTLDEAERVRRRIHLDFALSGMYRVPRTYVREVL